MNDLASQSPSVRQSEDGMFTVFTLNGAWLIVKNDPTNELSLHTNRPSTLQESLPLRKPLLKVPAVAEALGLSMSKVHEMLRSEEIPSLKIDKSRRVRQEDLDDFIERQMASQRRG